MDIKSLKILVLKNTGLFATAVILIAFDYTFLDRTNLLFITAPKGYI
jgi:hypothetical protein